MNLTADILYAGVYDRELDLFEGQYPVENGATYNSYIIMDSKVAVMDGVDGRFSDAWLKGIEEKLQGRQPDYIVVHHMEPDHGASVFAFLEKYPKAMMVASAQAVKVAQSYFLADLSQRAVTVKEGDVLDLGRHKLRFIAAPMVHWPEVMVSFDDADGVLFSADAFGTFGSFEGSGDWAGEAARYYFGIVGKFGIQAQNLLKKAAGLNIKMILPLHGPVLKDNAAQCVDLYSKWTSYTPEDEGVTLCYASVYGGTKAVAETLAAELEKNGQHIVEVFDLARCDQSAALAAAFRHSRLVLASPTINGNVFPAVKNFIAALADHNYQKRFIALIETGMWAPCSAKCMTELLGGCKDITFSSTKVKVTGHASEADLACVKALALELS